MLGADGAAGVQFAGGNADFRAHAEMLRLNWPAVVEETEHRRPIAFRATTPDRPGATLADPLELVLAARATASFPGAFPPLMLAEIDRLVHVKEAEILAV